MMPRPTAPAAFTVLTVLTVATGLMASSARAQGPEALTTVAERSAFARTGRFDEVQRLCTAFAAAWPKQVRCVEFGQTPEQRPMLALVASSDGTLTAAAAPTKGRPVVLMPGGIHAGQIGRKDAGLQALRE